MMCKTLILLLLLGFPLASRSEVNFDKYFIPKVLRVDYIFAGDANNTVVYPAAMKEEPFWAGPEKGLIDSFDYGNFRYEVYDEAENIMIYSRGFSSLYQEWLTTAEAKKMSRAFHEVVTMPFPKNKIRLVLTMREQDGNFRKLHESVIDPADYFILREKPANAAVSRIYGSKEPGRSVDLVFIAEGYKADEMNKFRSDVRRMADALFTEEPFRSKKDDFNIWAVEAVSQESGTDNPGESFYVNTVLNSGFYTFNLDRYLTTQDIKAVNDYAALAPHDNIIVLINTEKYGGGGVYNYYNGTSAGHGLSEKVFVHEFGHGFAGLADEYYTSSVSYEEFYPLGTEPWEPNITTLVNFDVKWKNMLAKNTPVPTPPTDKFKNSIGVFEGGGYSPKGIYRPEFDCRMKSNTGTGFCAVCRKALSDMIDFYTK